MDSGHVAINFLSPWCGFFIQCIIYFVRLLIHFKEERERSKRSRKLVSYVEDDDEAVDDERRSKKTKGLTTAGTLSPRGNAAHLSEHMKNAERFFQLNERAKGANEEQAANDREQANEEEDDDTSSMQPSKVWSWF